MDQLMILHFSDYTSDYTFRITYQITHFIRFHIVRVRPIYRPNP